ncbi:MAG: hypothetical protein WCI95_00290 [bacterium]
MKQGDKLKCKPAISSVLIQAIVPAVVGLIFLVLKKPVTAKVLWGISGLLLVSGLFIPAVFNRIEQFGRWFGKWAGTVITWGLMVPVFYLVFVPGRLILKLRGIDPMCRKFPTDAKTYWVPRKPVTNMAEYKRQF